MLFSLETYMIDFHSRPLDCCVVSQLQLKLAQYITIDRQKLQKWNIETLKSFLKGEYIDIYQKVTTAADTSDQSFRHFFWTFLGHFLPYVPAPWTPVWGTGAINLSRPRGGCGAGRLQSVKVRLVCGKGGRGVSNMGLPQRSVIMRQNMCPDLH